MSRLLGFHLEQGEDCGIMDYGHISALWNTVHIPVIANTPMYIVSSRGATMELDTPGRLSAK